MIEEELSDISRLTKKGLVLISYRPRSRTEIEKRLKVFAEKHSILFGYVTDAVNRLEELGYINDLSFAEWLISSYKNKRAKGRNFIERRLREFGISSPIIDQVLPHDPGKDASEARQLIEKKLALWKNLPIDAQKRRIQSFLGRRGYSFDIIYHLVDEYTKSTYNTHT